MKKFGFGLIGLVIVAAIYYFTAGSEKLTNEMKVRVNNELTAIQQKGFSVKEREVKAKKEHFVLSFDDPKKIVAFFKQQGSELSIEDAEALIGLKIGVDLKYLDSSYSALSADLYPLNLPNSISNAPDLEETDKIFVKQLNDMLARKALLLHVDFNKMLTGFKGYIKDIHETFKVETLVKIDLEGTNFEGKIDNDRVTDIAQTIQNIRVTSGDEIDIVMKKLQSHYVQTGNTLYDSKSSYSLANFDFIGKHEKDTFSAHIKNLSGTNDTSVTNGLASNKMKVTVEEMEMKDNTESSKLSHTTFAFNIGDLDVAILEALEKVDLNDEEESNRLIETLLSKGIHMEIPQFDVKTINYLGKAMDGFSITAKAHIKKGTKLAAIQSNPLAALNAINAKMKIVLSDTLFALIAQQPRAMMLAMIIQPKVVNGKKVYEFELKEGKISLNGQSLM